MTKIRLAILTAAMLATPLFAQKQPCPAQDTLPKIPEIVTDGNGLTQGSIVVSSAQVLMPFRVPASKPAADSKHDCYPQWVRIIRAGNQMMPVLPKGTYQNPMPGPTLRARVGDLVQLTFLNQVDPNVFPYSIDQGEKSFGCDQTSVYPANVSDKFPNCFHGSSTANIHFHGSHTNPNSTGDNVFIEVRPSPRTQDEANAPTVTAATVREPFAEFFKQCAATLKASDPLIQWPRFWEDLPAAYRTSQETLLKAYDSSGKYAKKLWPVDERQIAERAWPQYYIGAYPYCFRIPSYAQAEPKPPATHTHDTATAADAANTQGAGTAEVPEPEPTRTLQMGQAPGTHWYHAHKHGSTAINISNGMTGAFIMEGGYDDDLNAYYGANWTRTQPTMVVNQLGVSPNLERGGGGAGQGQDQGPTFSVNGRLDPIVRMQPGEVQLWRIVNTSSRAFMYMAGPPAGFQWRQLSQDGVQLNDANYQSAEFQNNDITLAPGNRADFLVKAPASAVTTKLQVMNLVTTVPNENLVPLLTVQVSGAAKPMNFIPRAPAFPTFLDDIKASDVKGTKRIVFATKKATPGGSDHFIDGKQFSGEVGEVVLLNTVEEWTVVNETFAPAISHPFHIHINPFQITELFDPNATIPDPNKAGATLPMYVLSQSDVTVPGQQCVISADESTWKPCVAIPETNRLWWDVFPIPTGRVLTDPNDSKKTIAEIPGYFKMRSRFVDYHGYYVIHCHILAHEDRGMMTIVEVAPLRSPYSHH
ncbi:MAG TPA: multicopper oxidase domain-containing protein [Thermoanaerobaculia bacterium]|jgi:FtsP/CotA-like multicopper oxidase with cupredoxin domain